MKNNNRYTFKKFFFDYFDDVVIDFLTALIIIILSPFVILFSPVIKFFVWKKEYQSHNLTEANNEFKENY